MVKLWVVKCPRCKEKHEYRNDRLLIGPMYRYCPVCAKLEARSGVMVYRARYRKPQPTCPMSEDD